MAKLIKDIVGQHPLQKYPWAKWLDGRARELRRGVDFALQSSSMTSLIRTTAAKRGLRAVVIRSGDDALLVQVVKREGTDEITH